jgi:Sec-independent protein translocase protein TatA
MVILILTVLVVGPDRLPGFAADLARWIRQARAYATHLTKDFNEVVSELEKEAGASREDWKEIASVVNHHTGDIMKEMQKVSTQIEAAGDVDGNGNGQPITGQAPTVELRPANVPPPITQSTHENGDSAEPEIEAEGEPAEEKPWYVPDTRSHRRPS